MSTPLRLLILEHDPYEVELEIATLKQAGYACQWERVETEAEFLACLNRPEDYDLILADYNLPNFEGLAALQLFLERDLNLPFIFVSSKPGEEIAIESLKAGATDYVLRGRLWRLELAVQRALREKEEQRQRQRAEEALWQSEERFHLVVSSISDHIYVTEVTEEGRRINLYLSPHVEPLTGYPRERFVADWSFWPSTVIHPDDREVAGTQAAQLALGRNSEVEYRLVRADGEVIWVRDRARVQDLGTSKITYGLVSDITEQKRAEAEVRKLNEELEQRVADRTRELLALYEVTTVASESLDLKTTIERSLERVLAAMRSNVGAIHLLDESDKTLSLAAQQGITPEVVTQIESIPSDNGLTNWVIEHSEPLVVPDIAIDPRMPQMARTSNFRTYVGVPMRARGRTLGVLSVLGDTKQQFNVEEVALLTSIADQVGVAVENARLRERAEQAAVMEERERLARELHDSVTQSLYSLTLFAEAGAELVKTKEWESVKHNFIRIGETAQQGLKEMRLLVHALRPVDLEREGLVEALHRRLNAVEGRVNVKTRLVADELVKLPIHVEEELYRIAQEALNNALKHGVVDSVAIYLRVEGEWVELEVVDDGPGFDPEAVSNTGGMGLNNMQERAEKLGGTLTILSVSGEGTRVKVRVKSGIENHKSDEVSQ